MKKFKIFISSVQKEFSSERKALKDYIYGDHLLSQFFEVFMFEEMPATDMRADKIYIEKVIESDIYLGLFGLEYGAVDVNGKSSTHKEFLQAKESSKHRLIFVKGLDDTGRDKRMLSLIQLVGEQLIRRRFTTQPELNVAVYASLVNYLIIYRKIVTGPFDATQCIKSEISDISEDKIRRFLKSAKNARDYTLSEDTPVSDVLTHLDLIDKGKPNNAAILLFGSKPQRFLISSEVKCMHFHTLRKLKPIPSYQIYKGTAFELVDQSVDFVMSKLNRSVGTRAKGPQAPVEYDIPHEVVSEGIVNAIAHRDYISNASIEVMLFSDRLEIWNPGKLPPSLTIDSLSKPHSSQPNNPLVAEPLFLTKYIEKAGTGTVDMFEHCKKAGLKMPEFKEENEFFILTIWRKEQLGQTEAIEQSPNKSNTQLKYQLESQPESSTSPVPVQYQSLKDRILAFLEYEEMPIAIISKKLGQKKVSGQLKVVLKKMLMELFIEYTIPDVPKSPQQKYRLTKKGSDYLKKQGIKNGR